MTSRPVRHYDVHCGLFDDAVTFEIATCMHPLDSVRR